MEFLREDSARGPKSVYANSVDLSVALLLIGSVFIRVAFAGRDRVARLC